MKSFAMSLLNKGRLNPANDESTRNQDVALQCWTCSCFSPVQHKVSASAKEMTIEPNRCRAVSRNFAFSSRGPRAASEKNRLCPLYDGGGQEPAWRLCGGSLRTAVHLCRA